MDLETLLTAVVGLLFLWALFAPLEWAFPKRAQKIFRREWLTDLTYFAGQQLFFRGLFIAFLAGLGGWLDGALPQAFRARVGALPFALQAVLVIVLCDFSIYWAHRLSHRVPLLWRFHRTHHTAEQLDWLAAYREHPVDGLYTLTVENLPALLLGFRLEAIAGFILFRGLWAVFIHSNVRLPLGPFKVLLGSPELHHWHHDKQIGGHKNFANLFPVWDVLFGTYHAPGTEPGAYGSAGGGPRSYLGQLAWPFVEPVRTRRLRRAADAADPAP